MDPKNPPNRVKEYRKARHMSLEGVSRACGLSYTTIWGIEQGRVNPTLKTAQAISEALGVTTDELFPEQQEASA